MKYNNFDLLRLFAAVQVVLMHANGHVMSEFGYSLTGFWAVLSLLLSYFPGVHIFFLISGFLISMSYEKNKNLRSYSLNRVLRIYPALYVNIFIGVIILFYFDFVQFDTEFFGWLIAQMSIGQIYNLEAFRGFGVGTINGVVWTLSVELIFYIILPFLIYIYTKNRFLIYIICLVSYLIFDYGVSSDKEIFYNKLLNLTILPYLFLFITGIFFYKKNILLKIVLNGKFVWWFSLFIVTVALRVYNIINFGFVLNILVWVIFSFMVFSFAFSFKGLSDLLLKGNDFSYGIYIYHMLVVNVFVHLKMVGDVKYIGAILALTAAFAMMSWFFIEKPCLKLKKHSIFKEMHK
jgi:peptidoglycan/LPS O-acetylase OafA/YrhL